jgi:hypothetical protein
LRPQGAFNSPQHREQVPLDRRDVDDEEVKDRDEGAGQEANQHFAPAHVALSQDLLEQGTLQHLRQGGADPADVAHLLWADLCRLSRVDA